MDLNQFVQLGVGGVAIVAIVVLCKEFVKFMTKQQDDFKEVITNHMTHTTAAMSRMEKTNDKLGAAVERLFQWLTKNGNSRQRS